jgi:PAS domain S-box-containing protein
LAQRTQELEGERDRTHSILEALGEAVVVTDLEGCIQYVNRAAIKLTGYKPEELLGQRMRLWRSHRQTAELYTQMLSKVQEGRTWRGEVINERKDGTLYDAALTVAPLYGGSEDKHPIGYVSVQHDITPVKEAERIKDQFVSNVSHELRTPLSVITLLVGNLDALYERMDDEKRRKLIRDIRGNIQVLNDLIINVLEISRLDGRHVARELQPLDLAQIVREEVEKQTLLAKNKYQNLLVDGVEHLPIHGSEVQLRQVIRNLVNNAIKYTPEGGYILCECQIDFNENGEDSKWPGHADLPEGPWVGVRIKDTGMGISDEDQTRLFERFFRVKSQGNVPGAGLGLSIAREIVKLHGGQISFASQVHEGSVFAVYFPLREVVS